MKMSTEWSRTADGVSFKEGGRDGPNDGNCPLQLVHLDLSLFEMMTNLNESPKVEHILVIVDNFTRYTRAYVAKDQKVSTAAKTLYKGFISILK